MVKIKLEIDVEDTMAAANELEHISQLVHQGWLKGDGWELITTAEKLPEIDLDEDLLSDLRPEKSVDMDTDPF